MLKFSYQRFHLEFIALQKKAIIIIYLQAKFNTLKSSVIPKESVKSKILKHNDIFEAYN